MGRSHEALSRFCEESYPRLAAALTHYCGDPSLGEELAQESLVVACRRWDYVGEMRDPVAWVYRVGVNLAKSRFRRQRLERRVRSRAGSDLVHRDPDGADTVAVRAALARLTPRQREVIVLRFFLDLSVGDTAVLTKTSPGAVRALTHRGISSLRSLLGPDHTVQTFDDNTTGRIRR